MPPTTAEKAVLICSRCGARRDTKRTPAGQPRVPSQSGWKRRPEGLYCKDCWTKAYRLTCLSLPIRPQDPKQWPELREALADAWGHTCSLANWSIRQFMAKDCVRLPNQEKMPPMPVINLYRLARDTYPNWEWWQGQCQAANGVLRAAEKRWRNDRYAVLWRNSQAPPTFRYGMPYPLDADAFELSKEGDGPYMVNCLFVKKRWDFILATGRQGRYATAPLRQLISGEALAVESAIYERRASTGDHRAGHTKARPGGGNGLAKRLFIKIVCWLPRSESAIARALPIPDRTLYVGTGPGRFLTLLLPETGRHWDYHADHIKQITMEYMLRLGKLSDDSKYEKRWPKRQRAQINDYRQGLAEKFHRRVDTYQKQLVASVMGIAIRNQAAKIVYDTRAGYALNPHAWDQLSTKLELACDKYGIAWEIASREVVKSEKEPVLMEVKDVQEVSVQIGENGLSLAISHD